VGGGRRMDNDEQTKDDAKIVVFVGPSIGHDEVQVLAPDAVVLPPVCQGDLLSACEKYSPTVAVIIDGEFGQSLSVWHKEVLFVLNQGIRVFGASSMGALRAAELDRFGMEGIGEIYRHYAGNFLSADEDVALLHSEADNGWRPLTIPMVNIWSTIKSLRSNSLMSSDACDAIQIAADSLHFTHRSKLGLEAKLLELGRSDASELMTIFINGFVDQKRIDAIEAISAACNYQSVPKPPFEEPLHLFGRIGESMQSTDTLVPSSHYPLRRYQLVNDVALHDPDFERLSQRALDRAAVLEYAFEAGVEPSEDEIAIETSRFLGTLKIKEDDVENWKSENDLSDSEFLRLMRDEAKRRHMQRWALDVRLYERNRRLILDQLRLENRYATAVKEAAIRRQLAEARTPVSWPTETEDLLQLVIRHSIATNWKFYIDLETTASDHGFEGGTGLVTALLDATAARQEASARRERLAKMFGFESTKDDVAKAIKVQSVDDSSRLEAQKAHSLVESHQITAILIACVDLEIADYIGDGEISLAELALRINGAEPLLERLLFALRELGVVKHERDMWSLTAMGEVFNSRHPGSLVPYVRDLKKRSIPAWAKLTDLIRGGEFDSHHSDLDADMSFGSATWALDFDRQISSFFNAEFSGCIVDVGGGLGVTARRVSEHCPKAQVVLVDRDEVIERASQYLSGSRVELRTLSTFAGPADFLILSRVLCTLPDEDASNLLSSMHQWCSTSSEIHIYDAVLEESPMSFAVDLFNLVRTGGGSRSMSQWNQLLAESGFSIVSVNSFVGPFSRFVVRPISVSTSQESK